jgi:hypothetical protein
VGSDWGHYRSQSDRGWFGHRANGLLADGVEHAGFIGAVIGLNAK